MNPMIERQTNLAEYQAQLGLHLRNPESEAAPVNLNERRLGVYRELVFNNVESQLSSAFPVIHGLFEGEQWLNLIREFLRDYRAQTPYFTKLSKEFLAFLASRPADVKTPAFLLELAHYERVEIDLFMQDEEHERVELSDDALLNEKLGLVSAVQFLAYAFPVHRIAPDFQPEQAPDTPTLLLLFQDENGEVRFFELQALAYQLVSELSAATEQTGLDLLKGLAENIELPFTETFLQQGINLLKQLNQLHVLRTR